MVSTASHRYGSPLRYPGGKGKLAPFLMAVVEQNRLQDGHYVEPYAGGASVAFSLLFHEYVRHVHINDLSLPIYAFWHSVLNESANFIRLVRKTSVTIGIWRQQREIQRHPTEHDLLEIGFSTFFLNRTNRSGILTGGVIGGLAQRGQWGIDARYDKDALIERIERIARFRSRVSLYNMDAAALMRSLSPELPARTLIYADPPYYSQGRHLYETHYQPKDHAEVADVLRREVRQPWVVSYDDHPTIRRLFAGCRQVSYQLRYTAAESHQGTELIFMADSLHLPASFYPQLLGAGAKVQRRRRSLRSPARL
jgi:DNA adenine methylase